VDCRSHLEALNLLHGKPPALLGLSSQLKQMKKDKLVLCLIMFGLLRCLLVPGHARGSMKRRTHNSHGSTSNRVGLCSRM
jgi:hypothetical protein